jgi:polysaccharide deacetylase family protein (PEP-CTERM system associated)
MASATMSIDWEDLSQMYGKYHYGKITEPVRGSIERQTKIILDLLEETDNKATFFILGALAQYRPGLVKEIAARGHEIGIHSHRHDQMFTLNYDQAKEDIATAQKIVTDIIGGPVYGYRAPFFSVKRDNLYVLEILADLGLIYDSSIFPMKLPRYGIGDFPTADRLYSLPNGKEIVELPMTVGNLMNRKWPVCGGGYMRLLPAFMVRKIFKSINANDRDSMIYMHPYEFDSEPIDISGNYPEDAEYSKMKVAALNFRWNIFRPSIINKLRSLLKEHHFVTAVTKAQEIRNTTTAVPLQ